MLVTLPLVQMNKARIEVNPTNQVQTKIKSLKVFKLLLYTESLGAHAIEYQIATDIF